MSDMSAFMHGFVSVIYGGSVLAQQPREREQKMHITHVTPLRTAGQIMDRASAEKVLQQRFPNAQMEPNFGYAPQRARCECAQIYVFSSCEAHGDELVLRFRCACCGHERFATIKTEGGKQAQVVIGDANEYAMVVYYNLVASPNNVSVN